MLMDVDVQYACTDACVRMLAGGYASVRILNAVGSGVHFCGIGLQGRESEHSGRGSKGARAGGGR